MAKVAKTKQPPTGKRGARQQYDRAKLVPEICARLATGKEPMTVICVDLGVPVKTVNEWRLQDKDIRAQFDEARDLGYDAIAADCMAIADDGRRDYAVGEDGRKVVDHDHISRSKLRVETRLKLLAKWDPRRYGDRMTLAGDAEIPVATVTRIELVAASVDRKD
jgi:hypothetical protein